MLTHFNCVDCTGASEAGLKWLRRAGFGTSNHRSDENDVHPLQKLKITYNSNCHSAHFQYRITPALAKRLPIPGGYYESAAIYSYIPHRNPGGLIIGALRSEADIRTGTPVHQKAAWVLTLSAHSSDRLHRSRRYRNSEELGRNYIRDTRHSGQKTDTGMVSPAIG